MTTTFTTRMFCSTFIALVSWVSAVGQESTQLSNAIEFDRGKIFDEIVTTVQENFFDRSFDVQGWRDRASQSRDRALKANSYDAFSLEINRLLSTLNTSHTHYFSRLDPKRYQLLGVFSQLYDQSKTDLFVYDGIGIDTEMVDGKRFVKAVYDGLPAALAGIRFGDQIVAIDQSEFHPILSFAGKANEIVEVEIIRNGKPMKVSVTVQSLDGRTMFETALAASIRVVERGNRKIGYLHPWSYAGTKYQDKIRETLLWGDLSNCDAVILDLRDGWGGADINYVNLFRSPIATVKSTTRSGDENNYSGVWGKPVALITNGGSTSGKELFTYGFKKLKLGKVFGNTTAGAVVGGRAFLLGNGDLLYLAVADIEVDGKRLEGVGVSPDFEVGRQHDSSADPQFEAACKYLSDEK